MMIREQPQVEHLTVWVSALRTKSRKTSGWSGTARHLTRSSPVAPVDIAYLLYTLDN